MRIIAGAAKGKTLLSPPETTRPTSDRAREGLFSSLESEFGSIDGLNFLDLFSGSGAVGAEALSRGAAEVYSVEQHEFTAALAEKNFQSIKNVAGSFHVIATSAHRFLSTASNIDFDIIFMDPPYNVENQEIEEMLTIINERSFLRPHGLIAVERETKNKPFSWPTPFELEKIRSYGQGSIFYGGRPASVLP